MKKFIVKSNDAGRSILKFIERMFLDVAKSRIERAFRNKDIKINGERIKDKTLILKTGDEVIVYGIESDNPVIHFQPTQKNFDVIFEDKNILCVHKHAGDVTNDAPNSLDEQVLHYLRFKQTDSFVPASIGRLDRVTSGIVVYAKNYETLRQLTEQQENFKKIYIFRSDLPQPITTTFKIKHDEEKQREVCGDEGKDTKTIFYFERTKKFAEIKTGRKHQIRATLSKLGYPIYGDRRYGGKPDKRVYLHAFSITFDKLSGDLSYLNGQEFMCQPNWN